MDQKDSKLSSVERWALSKYYLPWVIWLYETSVPLIDFELFYNCKLYVTDSNENDSCRRTCKWMLFPENPIDFPPLLWNELSFASICRFIAALLLVLWILLRATCNILLVHALINDSSNIANTWTLYLRFMLAFYWKRNPVDSTKLFFTSLIEESMGFPSGGHQEAPSLQSPSLSSSPPSTLRVFSLFHHLSPWQAFRQPVPSQERRVNILILPFPR